MMDVLLANVALWSGRSKEAIERGNDAIELFREIGDRWGEVMATGSKIRAHAELGDDDEYTSCLKRFYEVALTMPDESMHTFPNVVEGSVELQRGDPDAALAVLRAAEAQFGNDLEVTDLGAADLASAVGLVRMQLGEIDAAIAALEEPYGVASEDGARLAVGCRLALAYALARRYDDAREVLADLAARTGGTYSDRMLALWAESIVQLRTGGDPRGSIDAAYAIAAATDARLEHAISAYARARILAALGDPEASDAEEDANRQLHAMRLHADGWRRIFDIATEGVTAK
jgi:tetratricopeptide (TPR) repeat protein